MLKLKYFENYLNLCDEIPEEFKEKELYKNAIKMQKELEYKSDEIGYTMARYLFNLREVWLNKLPLNEVIVRDARHKKHTT